MQTIYNELIITSCCDHHVEKVKELKQPKNVQSIHFTPFSLTVSNVASEYCDFEFQPALTAACTGLSQPIISSAASLLASRMRRDPGGGCVSLARFQDLALAHWTHSAEKDRVQRGDSSSALWLPLSSSLILPPLAGQERR